LNKKPDRARTSKRRGRGQRSAARRARASSFLLVLVSLAFVCASVGHAYDVLPNSDGTNAVPETGITGLRKVVFDWISGGTAKNAVVAKYGPIEDWNVESVTSLKWVFYQMHTFNADISKWNTAAVTDMYGSTSTILLQRYRYHFSSIQFS
jgi:surface protein